jgi:hypothetical protein
MYNCIYGSNLYRYEKMSIYDTSDLWAHVAGIVETVPLFNKKPSQLLSISADSKTIKGEKYGRLTGIIYGSPANECSPNWTMCAMAITAQCDKDCLRWAGRGKMPSVTHGRIRKTLFLKQHQDEFMAVLVKNINSLITKAKNKRLEPAVRLCGTWDVKFENIYFWHNGEYVTIFDVFPNLAFYDYTKDPSRKVPKNYHLTFSYSGAEKFQKVMAKQLRKNPAVNIAVVFQGTQPDTFMGRTVINGDDSDLRFLDPTHSIVGLTAKGTAKHSNSPFIVRIN